jgi:hypothetical protein
MDGRAWPNMRSARSESIFARDNKSPRRLSQSVKTPVDDAALAVKPFLRRRPIAESTLTKDVGRALDARLRVDDRHGGFAKRAHELAGSSARFVTLRRKRP